MNDVEIFDRQLNTTNLPLLARDSRLPGDYRRLYNQLIDQALAEFPPIEGYETLHVMLVERAVYFFCKQKETEAEPLIIDLKGYKTNIAGFLRTAEAMLKEARSISAETTFKFNFIRQVVEVIDRSLPESESKKTVIRELAKLAHS